MLSNYRMTAYSAIILMCSLLSFPEDYRIDKGNILNQMFVKLGWFWTLALLAPLMLAPVKSSDKQAVSQEILKLATSTVIWYTSVNLFQYVDDVTGYDISGHTFLLIFSNLLIASELRNSRDRFEKSVEIDSKARLLQLFPLVLSLLWDFMLLQTALYYHTIVQKAVAAIWAFGAWFIMQRLFYNRQQGSVHY